MLRRYTIQSGKSLLKKLSTAMSFNLEMDSILQLTKKSETLLKLLRL